MSKRTILVHCLHGLRQPVLYINKLYAEKKCIKQPGYQILQCSDEKEAQELFNIKKEEYQRALNKSRIAILKNHLTKQVRENSIPEQSQYIDPKQRLEREKIINDLFLKHQFLTSPTFKSSPILISPLIQYEGYFDGASKNNPGIASAGYLLRYLNTVLLAKNELLGRQSNNQAQMMAMGFLLAHSYCNGVKRLRVFGDSKLAIEFMKGNYEAKHPNIISLFECNKHLSKTFKSIVFKHVMRDFNKEANKLASDAFTRNPKEKGSQQKPI